MAIRIPDSQRKDLEFLLTLSQEDFGDFVGALEQAGPAMSARSLASTIAKTTNLSQADIQGPLRATIALYATNERFHESDFVEQVVAEAERLGLLSGAESRQAASDRFSRLLTLENSIGVAARSFEIALEQQNPFERARILTDVRPVFSAGGDPTPKAAMVVHSLKIVSHGEDGHHAQFVACSGQELREIRDIIDRALKKEAALAAVLDKSGVPLMDVDFD